MGRTKKKINNIADLGLSESNLLKDQTKISNNINELLVFEKTDFDEKNKLENQIMIYDVDIITINDFKKKEKMLYDVLDNFFVQCKVEEVTMIIDIINGNHLISLRFLDWFVTRYCYLYKLSIPINNSYNKETITNINISYKAQLKSFKKRYFDPFRRKKKFNYLFNNYELNILTTLGQLNFFRWALSYDIIKYVEEKFNAINMKMSHVNSYFKKNIIESNSQTITTSEEVTDSIDKSKNSDKSSDSIYDDLSSDNNFKKNENSKKIINKTSVKLQQSDIDILMNNNNHEHEHNKFLNTMQNNLIKNKPSKIFNSLKNYQPTYKYPQVSRNISIEF
jgi:hypothetical protein